ncbi:MAG: TraR/DksA family transcriptional regulator [Pseudomonas sp.]|nr:TraR/DksA family transcriptional regulator [Pseudomonas sp.]
MTGMNPRIKLEALASEYAARAEAIERDLSRSHAAGFSEQATERQNDMVLQGLLADARTSVNEVQQALARLDAGTYGECEKCGEPISAARLEALPSAAFCIHCADE